MSGYQSCKKISITNQNHTFSNQISSLQQQHNSDSLFSMATSVAAATGFKSGFEACSFKSGENYGTLVKSVPKNLRVAKPTRTAPMMKNVNEGKGIFAPLVVVTRNIIGKKRFNQLRGKAIALHSQVITEFCKAIGADSKQRQGLIRLAKKNGEKLGFLA